MASGSAALEVPMHTTLSSFFIYRSTVMRHFFLFQPNPNAPAINVAAVVQRAGLTPDIPVSAIQALPPLQELAQIAANFPAAQQDTLLRYWQTQTAQFAPAVTEQFSKFFQDSVKSTTFSALQGAWNNFPALTVCCTLQSDTQGLLIVFDHLSIDSDGQIKTAGRPASVAGMQPIPQPATAVAITDDTADNLQTSTFSILNYIGAGLAATGFPIIGTIFQALFSIIASWLNPSSNIVSEILTQIQQMLEKNNITIETDFANAAVDTYVNWENMYFQQADFTLLSDPNADKTTQAYADAMSRATNFITQVHDDFMGTPRLFDAVNLMMGDTGVNTADLDTPTEAMFKFEAFLFFSGFVLFFGKQGWLYSQQINGTNSQTTRDLANAVGKYSTLYTNYVQQMSASIQQQISQRLGNIYTENNTGGAFWSINDNYNGPHEKSSTEPYKMFGYNGAYTFNYCGSSEEKKAEDSANKSVTEIGNDFTNYIYNQINPSATAQADLTQKIQDFISNDAKLQNLATMS